MKRRLLFVVCVMLARPACAAADDAALCRAAMSRTEQAMRIPDQFLSAIGRVETGRRTTEGGREAWPWSVNVEGEGHVYGSAAEAIAAVRSFQAQGARSIDVGCLQVNLFYHPDAFASLAQAFDPVANATYAGRLLRELFAETGSWPHAAAAYHSHTKALGEAYQRQVLDAWAEPAGDASAETPPPPSLQGAPEFSRAPVFAPPPVLAAGSVRPMLAAAAARAAIGMGGGRDLEAYRRMPVRLAVLPGGRR